MKRLVVTLLVLAIITVFLYGYHTRASQDYNVNSYKEFIEALAAKGHKVNEIDPEKLGLITVRFFSEYPYYIQIGDVESWVAVYEFEDTQTAMLQADTISEDGYSIGSFQISWISQPYFYHKNRLIVICISDDVELLADFEGILGKPI